MSAIEKAQALYQFASSQGCPLSTFVLVLSDAEAMEALRELVARIKRLGGGNEQMDIDWQIAIVTGNPWGMLQNFELMGFSMARKSDLN
jgi:hypothetical protein